MNDRAARTHDRTTSGAGAGPRALRAPKVAATLARAELDARAKEQARAAVVVPLAAIAAERAALVAALAKSERRRREEIHRARRAGATLQRLADACGVSRREIGRELDIPTIVPEPRAP